MRPLSTVYALVTVCSYMLKLPRVLYSDCAVCAQGGQRRSIEGTHNTSGHQTAWLKKKADFTKTRRPQSCKPRKIKNGQTDTVLLPAAHTRPEHRELLPCISAILSSVHDRYWRCGQATQFHRCNGQLYAVMHEHPCSGYKAEAAKVSHCTSVFLPVTHDSFLQH